jgi:hypothetical protein
MLRKTMIVLTMAAALTPGDRQGRMASWGTLSARRIHRNEHEPPGRKRHCLLQQARNMRAVDQGGQRRDQVDAAVGDSAAYRRTAAAATTSASMRRSMVMRSRATDGRSASECQGNGQIRSSNAIRDAWNAGSRPHLGSGLLGNPEHR